MTDIKFNGEKFSETKPERFASKSTSMRTTTDQGVWVGVSDSMRHMGDTSAVRALTEIVEGSFFDLSNQEDMSKLEAFIKEKDGKIKMIGAGNAGILAFNNSAKISRNIEFFLAIDRFYDTKLPEGVLVNILAPKSEIEMFQKNNPSTKITGHHCDMVASPSADNIRMQSSIFEENPKNIGLISQGFDNGFWRVEDRGVIFFLGGRVQLPDGTWKNNNAETFKQAAIEIMSIADGRDLLVISHGLRSFTDWKRVDGNDISVPNKECMDAFTKELASRVSPMMGGEEGGHQKVYILTKNDANETILKCFQERKCDVFDLVVHGNPYHYVLKKAAELGASLEYTCEQMNLPSEFKAIGGDLKKVFPYFWDISTENINKIVNERIINIEEGKPLISASDIFEKMFKEVKQEEYSAEVSKPAKEEPKKTWEEKEKERESTSTEKSSSI